MQAGRKSARLTKNTSAFLLRPQSSELDVSTPISAEQLVKTMTTLSPSSGTPKTERFRALGALLRGLFISDIRLGLVTGPFLCCLNECWKRRPGWVPSLLTALALMVVAIVFGNPDHDLAV